jgi:hypothetical protein
VAAHAIGGLLLPGYARASLVAGKPIDRVMVDLPTNKL